MDTLVFYSGYFSSQSDCSMLQMWNCPGYVFARQKKSGLVRIDETRMSSPRKIQEWVWSDQDAFSGDG